MSLLNESKMTKKETNEKVISDFVIHDEPDCAEHPNEQELQNSWINKHNYDHHSDILEYFVTDTFISSVWERFIIYCHADRIKYDKNNKLFYVLWYFYNLCTLSWELSTMGTLNSNYAYQSVW